MNRNMEDTRKWYIEHGMHAEFVKKYICTKCRYCDACYGLADKDARLNCKDFTLSRATYCGRLVVPKNRLCVPFDFLLVQK